ncbi:MAG: HAMP domain-containing histidine kinase [Proteobacteria bacterium]|uniref:ATP-binding protein n=1 Tax=Rudaea sp. TaxID=2136325 RepID=UPI0032209A7D|nr:HAMP domain-containing histidine kinase [Pseudomonadota bacterium]
MPSPTPSRLHARYSPRALAATLAWLRVCAVVGQLVTVLGVAHLLRLPIAEGALLAGIAALAVFDAFVWWRLRQPWPVGETEVVAHLAVDTCVLCYLLYLTGGATNPFVSLYIVPIALAAMALSPRHLAASVGIACLAYFVVLIRHEPLPDVASHAAHGADASAARDFNLHVLGMAVNFAISAVLLGFFIWRLARDLRRRETLAQHERERALRDEGILAIATQAAGAAHELNTPLSTIRTLVGELRREHPATTPLGEDLALLAGQAERCRDILRELVQVGSAQLTEQAQAQTLAEFVADCAERFRLLRPAVNLDIALADAAYPAPLRIVPALRHAILNLLNNAADASALSASAKVEFAANCTDADVVIEVRDHGPGLPQAVRDAAGMRFVSAKRDGLGLGLALTNATIERFHGSLRADTAAGGGTLTRLTLPLSALRALPQ